MANLSGFGVGNFKALKDYQWFELAPITILVGPNGSGKSSLVQAMLRFDDTIHYAQQYWSSIVHKKPMQDGVAFDVEYFGNYSADQFSSFDRLSNGEFNMSKAAAKNLINFDSNNNKIIFKSSYMLDLELVYSFNSLREIKISGKNNIIYTYFNLDSKEIIINWQNIKTYLVNEIDSAIRLEKSEMNFQPAEISSLYNSLLRSKIIDSNGEFSLNFHSLNPEKVEETMRSIILDFKKEEYSNL